ncbi:MAG TPA: T9SS type A sorting domain-containing protein [Bacteroidia bacterium]|nr:T9SS type A sorting domain-containing protein [Bacteroidia bacterium]
MKKILFTVLIFTCATSFAKKVKFSVDMTGQVLSPNGIHVTGDFQAAAGFPGGDWQANTTTLTQEGTTSIYSIIVDIPAFTKYEYRYVNGDQSYEVEFVPVESRVGYNFDDNRWLWVDSLANDTTDIGAIVFNANAPAGLTLVRFLVDMQNEPSIASSGVHVAGNFQGWDPAKTMLYSFGSDVYEIISYVSSGTYQYKFYNGNNIGAAENIPSLCAVSTNREIQVPSDTVLSVVCFSGCSSCGPVSIFENKNDASVNLFPNPAHDFAVLKFNDNNQIHTILISDVTGRVVRTFENYQFNTLRIEKENLKEGVYFVNIYSDGRLISPVKLIIE